jgi:hypothetical protein
MAQRYEWKGNQKLYSEMGTKKWAEDGIIEG